MPLIRPSADLRNSYSEISKICHETNEPVFITKNGYNDLVVLSNNAYEEIIKEKEEKVDKIIAERFDKHNKDFESFKRDIYSKIEQALNDIKNGNCSSIEEFTEEMEAKYHING